MIEIETRLKAWGNSIGIIIPREKLNEAGLNVDDEVEIIVKKKRSYVRESFGTYKFKTSTVELMKEIDADLEPK